MPKYLDFTVDPSLTPDICHLCPYRMGKNPNRAGVGSRKPTFQPKTPLLASDPDDIAPWEG